MSLSRVISAVVYTKLLKDYIGDLWMKGKSNFIPARVSVVPVPRLDKWGGLRVGRQAWPSL